METRSDWGRLNAGQKFNVLALDLDRALAWATIGMYEAIVLEQARELCWHGAIKTKRAGDPWPEPVPARINITALARVAGVEKRRLTEAKARLVACRMLIAEGDMVRINKDAHQWTHPTTGRPRLTPGMLRHCALARPPGRASRQTLPLGTPPGEGAKPPREGGAKPPPLGGAKPPRGEGAKPPRGGALNRPGGGRQTAPPHIEERAPGDLKKTEEDVCVEGEPAVTGDPGAVPVTHNDLNLSGDDEAVFAYLEKLVAGYQTGSNGTLNGTH